MELDGEDDHVHLLVNYPPKVAVHPKDAYDVRAILPWPEEGRGLPRTGSA